MANSETVSAIIFTVLYAVTIVASVTGNTLLIYIVWKKPEVRSLASFMFVNMAVADLLVSLAAMPWSIAFFYTKGKWPVDGLLGDISCRGSPYATNVTVMASILCLMFMAIDRYYACVWPLNRRSAWFRKAKFVAPLVWITSMLLMSFVTVIVVYRDGLCTMDFAIFGLHHEETLTRAFFCYGFFIGYMLPLVVITVLYAKVAHKIWFHKVPGNQLIQNQQRRQIAKRNVVRMLIIIVVTFALCWLPAQSFNLYLGITAFSSPVPYWVMYLVFWLGHANSAINPWLYIRLSSNIKLAFVKMVNRRFTGRSSSLGQRTKSTKAALLNNQQVAEARL